MADLRDALRLRRWRRSEAGLLADKAAWWARQAEEAAALDRSKCQEFALMFATVAKAMKAVV